MISYAQNFEDVMLWRALKHIKKGFYLDIGANDPIDDSVTKWFYESGWHGINIEPLAAHFKDLVKDRPNDINLNFAIGESPGSIDLWVPERRGWATANLAVIDAHKKNGHKGEFIAVEQKTLNQIFSEYVKNDIHFMKIDVEGFEKQVLEGLDLKKNRPWIIVIEATKPNSNVDNHKEWEYLIRPFDYSCIYFDGLNRFYLAKEHIDLAKNFNSPPNVFDEFSHWHSQVKAKESEAKAKELEACLKQRLDELQALYASKSWQITSFLRILSRSIRACMQLPKTLITKIKIIIKRILVDANFYIIQQPTLKRIKLFAFTRFPTLKGFLKAAITNKDFVTSKAILTSNDLVNISPSSRKILEDLNAAIEERRKESN